MCMTTLLKKHEIEELKKDREEIITLYKAVEQDEDGNFKSPYYPTILRKGINIVNMRLKVRVDDKNKHYESGFHFFEKKEDAQILRDVLLKTRSNKYHTVIAVKVKRKWISTAGYEGTKKTFVVRKFQLI